MLSSIIETTSWKLAYIITVILIVEIMEVQFVKQAAYRSLQESRLERTKSNDEASF